MLLRIAVANIVWLDGDEGCFLYDALLWSKGFKPFKDFLLGSPLYVYFIRASMHIFGNTIFAGRVVPVILSTITIFLVFLIGKRIWNTKTGLITSMIVAFSPFAILWGATIKTEPNVSFFVALAFYLFIVGSQEKKKWLYVASGLILGMVAYVRLSAFVFFLVLVIYIFYEKWFLKEKETKLIRNIVYITIGFSLSYLSILWYLAIQSSLTDVLEGWSPVVLKAWEASRNKNISALIPQRLTLLSSWFLYIIRDAAYFMILPLAYLLIYLKNYIKPKYIFWVTVVLFSALIAFVAAKGVLFSNLASYYGVVLLGFILFLIPVLFVVRGVEPEEKPNKWAALIGLWFVVLLSSYLVFSVYSMGPSYFYELSIPAALFSGYVLSRTFTKERNILFRSYLVIALILIAVLPFPYYQITHGEARYWSLDEIEQVSKALKERKIGSSDNDIILTGNNIVLYTNDLKSFGNISHPVNYLGEKVIPDEVFKRFHMPTQPEIIDALNSGEIKYIIWDSRTKGIFTRYPKIMKAIDENYYYFEITDRTKIFKYLKK